MRCTVYIDLYIYIFIYLTLRRVYDGPYRTHGGKHQAKLHNVRAVYLLLVPW